MTFLLCMSKFQYGNHFIKLQVINKRWATKPTNLEGFKATYEDLEEASGRWAVKIVLKLVWLNQTM